MRKTESTLEHYKKFETTFSDNLKLIIEVFEIILKQKGSSMKSIDLRTFIKNIKKEIDCILFSEGDILVLEKNILISEEDIVIGKFIRNHYSEIEIYGSEALFPLFDNLDIKTYSEELKLYKKAEAIYLRMSNSRCSKKEKILFR